MHRVLAIPEILDFVFSFIDQPSNARSARVCRLWSSVALDTLWRHVGWLGRLFELMAPLSVGHVDADDIIHHVFMRPIEPTHWPRFHSYARRVRYLTVDDRYPSVFENDVFAEVARARQTLNLLPNLIHLKLLTRHEQPLHFCAMFLHENLSRLTVNLPPSIDRAGTVLREVAIHAPKLAFLDLRMTLAVRLIQDDLMELVSKLNCLKKIVLPRYTISAKVMTALSMLPNLGTIQFEYFVTQGMGDPSDVADFSPAMQQGAFPSLWDLSFHAKLSDASRFFNTYFAPTNITSLFIHTLLIETPESFCECLTILSETCNMLTYLGLDLCAETIPGVVVDNTPGISFEELRPILSFPNLTTFELTHHRPLLITEEDVAELASKWPSLEGLQLNPEPISTDAPLLTLGALTPFAYHCPNLRSLALHVNAIDYTDLPMPKKPFAMLKKIEFGISPIADVNPVALYLSQICPVACEVGCGVTWPDQLYAAIDVTCKEMMHSYVKNWEHVGTYLPLLTELRKEERDRTLGLEREVEDLRTRVQILESQLEYPKEPICVAL